VIVVNNAASGYVKALQHAMMGGRYQSADLVEMNYAAIARAMGCGGIRVEDPETLSDALRRGMEERDRPTVIDVVVTRDPAQMLPAVESSEAIEWLEAAGSALEPLRARRPAPARPQSVWRRAPSAGRR
jgi:thiamine pyrophosphate-dependent acetolactate synthase large subunit-like protein